MSALKFTLRGLAAGDAPSARRKYFDILSDYLQPGSSAKAGDAARSIDALGPHKQEGGGNAKGTEDFVWEFWNDVDQIASQIPHDYDSQDKLVDVIQELKALPPSTITVWGNEQRLWADLPLAGPVFRDAWVGPKEGDPISQQQWVNKNAFFARLFRAQLVIQKPNFAIWTMRDALESTPRKDLHSCHVSAAATWIDYAGSSLYDWASESDNDEQFANVTAPGELFKGPGGLTKERWAFWQSRFESLAKESDVDEAKTKAGDAATKMTEVQSSA